MRYRLDRVGVLVGDLLVDLVAHLAHLLLLILHFNVQLYDFVLDLLLLVGSMGLVLVQLLLVQRVLGDIGRNSVNEVHALHGLLAHLLQLGTKRVRLVLVLIVIMRYVAGLATCHVGRVGHQRGSPLDALLGIVARVDVSKGQLVLVEVGQVVFVAFTQGEHLIHVLGHSLHVVVLVAHHLVLPISLPVLPIHLSALLVAALHLLQLALLVLHELLGVAHSLDFVGVELIVERRCVLQLMILTLF